MDIPGAASVIGPTLRIQEATVFRVSKSPPAVAGERASGGEVPKRQRDVHKARTSHPRVASWRSLLHCDIGLQAAPADLFQPSGNDWRNPGRPTIGPNF